MANLSTANLVFRLRASDVSEAAVASQASVTDSVGGVVLNRDGNLGSGSSPLAIVANAVGGHSAFSFGANMTDNASGDGPGNGGTGVYAADAGALQSLLSGAYTVFFVARIFGGGFGTVFAKRSGGGNRSWISYGNYGIQDGHLHSYTSGYDSGVSLNDGAWHAVAISVDASGNATTYVDGTQTGTTALVNAAPDAGAPFALAYEGSGNFCGKIQIAEIGFYTGALAAQDVAQGIGAYTQSQYGLPIGQVSTALAAGTIGFASVLDTTATIAGGDPTGGTAPYSYAWYRGVGAAPTIDSAHRVSTAESLGSVSGLAASTNYYYTRVVTDSVGATASATVSFTTTGPAIRMGFAGDSISILPGAGQGNPGDYAGKILGKLAGFRPVAITNMGVAGAGVQNDATGWAPGTPYYNAAVSAFASAGVTHVSLMLGMNNRTMDKATYKADLLAIVNGFVALGYKVILHHPTSEVTGDGYNANLQGFGVAMDEIAAANPSSVFVGDVYGFAYFQTAEGAALLTDGGGSIHPDDAGRQTLGEFWAYGIARAMGLIGGGAFAINF